MITLDSVSKQYDGKSQPAINNVSLHIEKGEFVFVVGKQRFRKIYSDQASAQGAGSHIRGRSG